MENIVEVFRRNHQSATTKSKPKARSHDDGLRCALVMLHPQSRAEVGAFFAKRSRKRQDQSMDPDHALFQLLADKGFNNKEFEGASRGWENQILSNRPKQELVTILATLELGITLPMRRSLLNHSCIAMDLQESLINISIFT